MNKSSGKLKYLAMNLLAPGIAQFALRWWLRGLLQLGGAAVCFLLAAWQIVGPLFHNISGLINDSSEELENPDISSFFRYFLVLLAIWIWSFIDIIIFCRPRSNAMTDNNEGE